MEEDCSLVFTTSRGQVKMAPTVPPHLEKKQQVSRKKWENRTEARPGKKFAVAPNMSPPKKQKQQKSSYTDISRVTWNTNQQKHNLLFPNYLWAWAHTHTVNWFCDIQDTDIWKQTAGFMIHFRRNWPQLICWVLPPEKPRIRSHQIWSLFSSLDKHKQKPSWSQKRISTLYHNTSRCANITASRLFFSSYKHFWRPPNRFWPSPKGKSPGLSKYLNKHYVF